MHILSGSYVLIPSGNQHHSPEEDPMTITVTRPCALLYTTGRSTAGST
ncbi:hypothetical protein ACWDOR_34500 [Streptosporangium canum]